MIKSELRPDDLVEVDLGGSHTKGYREATTELDLHLRVYRRREDCGAVVHAHPPTAAVSGTPALGDAVEPFLDRHVALLLANHGALTWGRDLAQARIRMESLEHGARILLAARALGRVNHLTRDQIDVLERMRGNPSYGQNDHGN
jgi:L-fuculose-phosphate aldolase